MSGFQLHLKYDEIPFPCRGAMVLIEFLLEQGTNKEKLAAMSRIKRRLNVCTVPVQYSHNRRKHLEDFAIDKNFLDVPTSRYMFLREEPTARDCEVWKALWVQHTVENSQLHTPLGN